jgi:hypothetical protein
MKSMNYETKEKLKIITFTIVAILVAGMIFLSFAFMLGKNMIHTMIAPVIEMPIKAEIIEEVEQPAESELSALPDDGTRVVETPLGFSVRLDEQLLIEEDWVGENDFYVHTYNGILDENGNPDTFTVARFEKMKWEDAVTEIEWMADYKAATFTNKYGVEFTYSENDEQRCWYIFKDPSDPTIGYQLLSHECMFELDLLVNSIHFE